MNENEIVDFMLKNGGKTTSNNGDIKIQYNKRDITAIFKKSACEKCGVEKIASVHFSDVKALEKALEKLEKEKNITLENGVIFFTAWKK